jgi:hypothetical protein
MAEFLLIKMATASYAKIPKVGVKDNWFLYTPSSCLFNPLVIKIILVLSD